MDYEKTIELLSLHVTLLQNSAVLYERSVMTLKDRIGDGMDLIDMVRNMARLHNRYGTDELIRLCNTPSFRFKPIEDGNYPLQDRLLARKVQHYLDQ